MNNRCHSKFKRCLSAVNIVEREAIIIKDKYETNVLPHLISVEEWVLEGLTQAQIAQRLGVSCRTFSKYKREHEELRKVLERKPEEIIKRVEEALLKRAVGYTYTEKKVVDKGDKTEETFQDKEMAPDLKAIDMILKTYCPEKWGGRNEEEKSNQSVGVVILPEILTEEED